MTDFPCAACGKPIKYSASKCPHCEHKVTPADIQARSGGNDSNASALLGCIGVPALIAFAIYVVIDISGSSDGQPKETYRLVHAIGNDETFVARGLQEYECRMQRDELKEVATALGTYNETTGHGSITCQPESSY